MSIAALAIGAPFAVRSRPRTTCARPNRLTNSVRLPRRPQCAVSRARSLAPSPLAAPRNAGSDPGPMASLDVIVRVTGPKIDVRFPAASSSSTRTMCWPCGSLLVSMSSEPSSIRSGHGCRGGEPVHGGIQAEVAARSRDRRAGPRAASVPSSSTIARNRPAAHIRAVEPKMHDPRPCLRVDRSAGHPPTGGEESSTSNCASTHLERDSAGPDRRRALIHARRSRIWNQLARERSKARTRGVFRSPRTADEIRTCSA